MNLKQIQFVIHIANTRSFSRAAELSFVTQPTLSNAVSQLEDELGGRLFKRTTRRVELTSFGEYMLPRFEEILQSKEELLAAAKHFHNPAHQMLRIGFSPLVDMKRLNLALSEFRQQHPDIKVFFKECFIDELDQRLQKNQIDIQVVPEAAISAQHQHDSFYQDKLFYLPSSPELKKQERLAIELADLPDTPLIMTGGGCGLNRSLEQLFSTHRIDFSQYQGQAMSYQVIEDWTSLGIGAGILPEAKLSSGNDSARPIFIDRNTPAVFSYHWVWHEENNMPEHLIAFIETIRHIDEVPQEALA